MTRNNGGSAFPPTVRQDGERVDGMSLRDWFAGQVAAGIGSQIEPMIGKTRLEGYNWDHMAECAYKIAAALLRERKEEELVQQHVIARGIKHPDDIEALRQEIRIGWDAATARYASLVKACEEQVAFLMAVRQGIGAQPLIDALKEVTDDN